MTIIPPEKLGVYLSEAEKYGVLPMFFLELSSGLRRGELLALRWDDLNVKDRTGGAASSRESDVAVISSSGYGETPVTVKNVLPTFRGAIVLCDGAENAAVRLAVTQAVETVCGLTSDRITVLKRASGA